MQPFDTPSYELSSEAVPYVEYDLDIHEDDSFIEVRTLPTLRVYEGRDARYAIQLGDSCPVEFSIHEGDFTSEWRWNVLRGYATRSISLRHADRRATAAGPQRVRVYFLDPGIVLQEILVK